MAVCVETTVEALRRVGVRLQRDPAGARLPTVGPLSVAPGLLPTGALAVLADCGAGMGALYDVGLGSHVTTSLGVHRARWSTTAPSVLATSHVLRRRRDGAVLEVEIREDDGEPGAIGALIGLATVTFVELEAAGPLPPAPEVAWQWPPGDLYGSLEELVTTRPAPGDEMEADIADHLRNPAGMLNGGVSALLVDRQAVAAAQREGWTQPVAGDMLIQYLGQGLVGPVRTRTRVARRSAASVLARVELVDTGAGDRAVVAATITVMPAEACEPMVADA